MSNRNWRDDEEDWSETGAGYDSGGDSEFDDPDFDDAIRCPDCGADIYAELDCCPRCGYWLSDADRNPPRVGLFDSRTTRFVAAILLLIFLFVLVAGSVGSF